MIKDNRDGRRSTWQLHWHDMSSKKNTEPRPSVTDVNTRSSFTPRKNLFKKK